MNASGLLRVALCSAVALFSVGCADGPNNTAGIAPGASGVPGTPSITSTSPAQLPIGSATVLYVYGTNLVSGSVIQCNGVSLATNAAYGNYEGFYLFATIPASFATAAGTVTLTVYDSAASPSTSSPYPITIPAYTPSLTSLTNSLPVTTATTVAINTTNSFSVTGLNLTGATFALNGVTVPAVIASSTQATVTIPASAIATPNLYLLTASTSGGTSGALSLTGYVPMINNNMIYNPVNGLFYLSVPSTAAVPYANSIVPVNPTTGALGTPIAVGSNPDKMALTADGRYLWVELDGSYSIRQVDLIAGTVGPQLFPIPNGVGVLAALPGMNNSVVVANGYELAIVDSGVARSSSVSFSGLSNGSTPAPAALIVNGTTNEIYGPGNSQYGTYSTYQYSAAGVTVKATNTGKVTYAGYSEDDIQIAAGQMYTDLGEIFNAETGVLLGTFNLGPTVVAQGPEAIDTTLGKAFILANNGFNNILESFYLSSFAATTSSPLIVSVPVSSVYYPPLGSATVSRLTRWGTNGLAYRSSGGFVSLTSSALVQ